MDWMDDHPSNTGCGFPNFGNNDPELCAQHLFPKPESQHCASQVPGVHITLAYIKDQIHPAESYNSPGQQLGGNAIFG